MKKGLGLFGIFFLLSSFLSGDNLTQSLFRIEIPNEGYFDVFQVVDGQNLLQGYKSDIKAPVCEDKLCYDVEITFHWNAIGEFQDFEVQADVPLTKLDHVPFATNDYEKLSQILTSSDLQFVKVPMAELVEKPQGDGLDAVSGATKATLKKEVIDGALYTCYTLWHIANGQVVDSIRSHTRRKLNPRLISNLIKQESQSINYFLINNLDERGFESNLEEILNMAKKGDGFLAKNTFEAIPTSIYNSTELQLFLSKHYSSFSYHTRLAILKKLLGLSELDKLLLKSLSQNLSEKNSLENRELKELLSNQSN